MMDSKLCMNGRDENTFSKLVHSYSHRGWQMRRGSFSYSDSRL